MDDIEIDNAESDFQFETDHLALRGNKDYCELLKYVVKLEAQKVQTLKDIEVLVEERNKAMEDPLMFVQDLQKGVTSFPTRQIIADIPHIDWCKYGLDSYLKTEEVTVKSLDNDTIIRGRKFTDSKPETFNQLWSCEEQKRLEELLLIYPEEAVESHRYKKIAQAMGTRTGTQVMSRVQKYFAKLAKAGLPIPGRQPKRLVPKEKSIVTMFNKKSTFFPQLHVPVKMEDVYEDTDFAEHVPGEESQSSNLGTITLLRNAKKQRALDEKFPIWQVQTMCVGCQKTGFLGARWTDNAGTDYCTDCVVRLLPEEQLIPVRT